MLQVSFLLASFAGYFLLLYILFKGKKTALYPALLVSGIIAASFGAGLLGCLQSMYGFIYIAGFVLLPLCICHLVKNREFFPRPRLSDLFPFAVLAAGAFMLYFAYDGHFLYQFDDFSHWGKVTKVINENMRLPISADALNHGTYPPASALFMVYVSTVMGAADDVWLFAHMLMLLCFWLSLLAASRKLPVQILLALMLNGFMRFVVSPASLYVDTLLAAASFACMMALESRRHPEKALPALALLLCAVVLIKNSGLFLALMIAAYAVYLYRKEQHRFSPWLLVLVVPFLSLGVWKLYCSVNLANATSHQMTVEHYVAVAGGKSAADLKTLLGIVLPLIINPARNIALMLIPGYLLMLLVFWKQGTLKAHRHLIVFSGIMLLVYELGVVMMYIFSMPMEEVLLKQGSDYDRYNCTIAAILAAVLLVLVCRIRMPEIHREKMEFGRVAGVAVPALAVVVLLGAFLTVNFKPLQDEDYRINRSPTAYCFSVMRDKLEKVPEDAACIILHVEPDEGEYHRYISSYYLPTQEVVNCYTRKEVNAMLAENPRRYYIDLLAGEVHLPAEVAAVLDYGCTNILDSVGFKQNTRYSSSYGKDVEAFHWDITGHIPVQIGDVIRLKNVTWYPSEENESRGGLYWFRAEEVYRDSVRPQSREELKAWQPVYDEAGNIIQVTVPEKIGTTSETLRIICQDINSKSIITINEEIP